MVLNRYLWQCDIFSTELPMTFIHALALVYAVYFKERIDNELLAFDESDEVGPLFVTIASSENLTKWLLSEYSMLYRITYTNQGKMYRYQFVKSFLFN